MDSREYISTVRGLFWRSARESLGIIPEETFQKVMKKVLNQMLHHADPARAIHSVISCGPQNYDQSLWVAAIQEVSRVYAGIQPSGCTSASGGGPFLSEPPVLLEPYDSTTRNITPTYPATPHLEAGAPTATRYRRFVIDSRAGGAPPPKRDRL